jgi:hypothetical protein
LSHGFRRRSSFGSGPIEDRLTVRRVVCALDTCGRVFFLCPGCDRGHRRYCGPTCRDRARWLSKREARHRYQQSPEGRKDHRDHQRAFRRRGRLVMDQSANNLTPGAIVVLPLPVRADLRPPATSDMEDDHDHLPHRSDPAPAVTDEPAVADPPPPATPPAPSAPAPAPAPPATGDPICARCGRRGTFVRRGFLDRRPRSRRRRARPP